MDASQRNLDFMEGRAFDEGMKTRWLVVMMALSVVASRAQDVEKAKNLALLRHLPDRITAVRQTVEAGLSSGVTADMQQAMGKYNEALKGMIFDLGKTFYAKPLTKAEINKLEAALVTRALFEQKAGNPSGEPLGTMASLDVMSSVSEGLEVAIVVMAQALLEEKSNPPFEEWKKNWDKATLGK